MKPIFRSLLVAVASLFAAAMAMAQHGNGPVRLGPDEFGKPGFGARQALGSDLLEDARQLGLFEDTVNIRSGWIDAAAQITGRLDIRTAGFDPDGNSIIEACTATAISDSLILTNAHCVWPSGRKRALALQFLPNFRDARRLDDVIAYPVRLTPVERGDPERLDYAILQLLTPLKRYRPLAFNIRDPGPGEPLVVLGHPEGQPLLLSRGRCRSDQDVPLSGADVIHQCATRKGSSGSLIWSSDGHVVGLHYKGGTTLAGRTINRAVRMAALLPESPTLQRLLQGATAVPRSGCDQVTVPDGHSCVIGADGQPQIVPASVPPAPHALNAEIEIQSPSRFFQPAKVVALPTGGFFAIGGSLSDNTLYSVIAEYDHKGTLGPVINRPRENPGAFFRLSDAATDAPGNLSVLAGNTYAEGWGEIGAPKLSMRDAKGRWVDLPVPIEIGYGRTGNVTADRVGGFHVVFFETDNLEDPNVRAIYAHYRGNGITQVQRLPDDIVFASQIIADPGSGFVLLGQKQKAGAGSPIAARFDARGHEIWRITGGTDEVFQTGLRLKDGSLIIGSTERITSAQTTILRTRKIDPRGNLVWERQTRVKGGVALLGANVAPSGQAVFTGHWEQEYYGPSEGIIFAMEPDGVLAPGRKTKTDGKTRFINTVALPGGQIVIAQQRGGRFFLTPIDQVLSSAR